MSRLYREDFAPERYRKGSPWYNSIGGCSSAGPTTKTLAANRLYGLPFFVPGSQKFDRIAINVITAAGTKARLGVYADDGLTTPGRLVLDAGEVDTSTTGVKEIAISLTLSEALFWLAMVATSSSTLVRAPTPSVCYSAFLGVSSAMDASYINFFYRAYTYGALPDPFGTGLTPDNIPPGVYLRRIT